MDEIKEIENEGNRKGKEKYIRKFAKEGCKITATKYAMRSNYARLVSLLHMHTYIQLFCLSFSLPLTLSR